MTQAECVFSTQPTNTSVTNPVDPTRRSFIAVAAGASIISVGSLAAVAMPISAPQVSDVPIDPIYDAIEAHRKAYATMQAVFAEHRKAHSLADAKIGPTHIEIPSMVAPSSKVTASHWMDIERAIPRRQYPDLHSHHKRLLDERREAHAAIVESLIGDEDEATDEVAAPELETLRQFEATVPATLAGLLAMVIYAGEIKDQNADAFDDRDSPIFENMATAARALVGGRS
jgi:hypothetical protein